MRRVVKWIVRIGCSLLAVVVAGLVALVGPVDDRPYIRSAYHTNTVQRLEAAFRESGQATESAPVRAGWTRVKLTPRTGVTDEVPEEDECRWGPLAGFGARRGAPAEGVHDDVWVKAVALESGGRSVVFVGMDALIVPREVSDAAAAELLVSPGLRREQLYFGATHTHSSLGGWGEGLVAHSASASVATA